MNLNSWVFRYLVYYPVIILRGEWLVGHLNDLRKSQYQPPDGIRDLQLARLNKLLAHAKRTVPFYSDLPELSLKRIDDISELPFLEKDQLRREARRLCSAEKGYMTREKTTGGSTGAAVTIRKDCRGMAQELAATWRGYQWAGIDIGDKQARFWGVPQQKKDYLRSKLVDLVTNRLRFSAFSFSEKELGFYVEKLKASRPVYFYGYVSMIKQLADYIEKTGQAGALRPKAVITTSEVLSEPDRAKISEVFGCKVYDEYGCGEIGTIAHECEHGSMHVSAENMIVEIVDENGKPVEPGRSGEIVVTDLVNFSMPLIRYRIKDYATMGTSRCPCGRQLPVLSNIHGREYDMLVNSKGEKFHGEFFLYMVEELKQEGMHIEGFQLTQESDRLVIRLKCPEEVYPNVLSKMRKLIAERFDQHIAIEGKKVSEIKREPSGKLRVIRRER